MKVVKSKELKKLIIERKRKRSQGTTTSQTWMIVRHG